MQSSKTTIYVFKTRLTCVKTGLKEGQEDTIARDINDYNNYNNYNNYNGSSYGSTRRERLLMWAMSTPALRSIATASTNNNNNNNTTTTNNNSSSNNSNADDVIVIDQNDSKKRKRTKSSPNNKNNNNSSSSTSSSMDMKATGSLVTFTQLITILTQPGVPHSLFNIGCGSEESCTPSTLKEIRGKGKRKKKAIQIYIPS